MGVRHLPRQTQSGASIPRRIAGASIPKGQCRRGRLRRHAETAGGLWITFGGASRSATIKVFTGGPLMALMHPPRVGSVLWCDFRGYIAPEMVKRRPVVVVARHKENMQLVSVVPLSTTRPDRMQAYHHHFAENPMPGAVGGCWAKCDMVATVSLQRLDLVRRPARRGHEVLRLHVSTDVVNALKKGIVAALMLLPAQAHPVGVHAALDKSPGVNIM